MNNYQDFLERKEVIEDIYNKASKALVEFTKPHKNNIGLIPNEIRTSEEYQKLKVSYNIANRNLCQLNRSVPKLWLRKASQERREAKLKGCSNAI